MWKNALNRWMRVVPLLAVAFFLFGFEQRNIRTEQGLYSVDVLFTGSAMKVGKNSLEITVNDQRSRKPIEHKLAIEVVPWMPMHEHGSTERAAVTYLGKGRYLVENVTLTMPGDWEVYFKIIDGGKEDTAVVNVLASR